MYRNARPREPPAADPKVLQRFRAPAAGQPAEAPSPQPNAVFSAEVIQALQRVRSTLLPTVLTLNYYDLSNEDAELIAQALLEKNMSMTGLSLGCNRIGSTGLSALALALQQNNRLTSLKLQNNQIDDTGVIELGRALKSNSSLTELWLGDNRITSKGLLTLAEALTANRTLLSLRLDKNSIDNDGARLLAGVAKFKNNTLEVLDLRFNDITDSQSLTVIQQKLHLNFVRPRVFSLLVGSRPRVGARSAVLGFTRHRLFDANVLGILFDLADLKLAPE